MTQTNMYGVPRLEFDEPDPTPTKTGFFGINKETNKMVLKKHNETVSTYFKSIS